MKKTVLLLLQWLPAALFAQTSHQPAPKKFSLTTQEWLLQQRLKDANTQLARLYTARTLNVCNINNYGCGQPLPITQLELTGTRLSNDKVRLNWKTLTELNNSGFEIERRVSYTTTFNRVGFVQGRGTTNSRSTYESLDDNSYNDVTYYRLRQIDYDGKSSYSNTIAIKGYDGKLNVRAWPNPVAGNLVGLGISGYIGRTTINITLTDVTGKILFQKQNVTLPANHYYRLSEINLLPGSYYVRVTDGEQMAGSRLIVSD